MDAGRALGRAVRTMSISRKGPEEFMREGTDYCAADGAVCMVHEWEGFGWVGVSVLVGGRRWVWRRGVDGMSVWREGGLEEFAVGHQARVGDCGQEGVFLRRSYAG
jgi:hypothetical protein